MKILYLITELDLGGAERMLFETVKGTVALGADVQVACLLGDGLVADWLRAEGIKVFPALMRQPSTLWRFIAVRHRVRKLIDEFRPDVLHTWLFHANLVGRFAARAATHPPRVISSIRVYDNRKLHHWLDKFTLKMVDRVTVNSEVVKTRLVREQGYPQNKIEVIHNSVSPSVKGELPGDIIIPRGEKLVVSVGRQHPQKGFDVLLKAVPRIRKTVLSHFLIVGRVDEATFDLKCQVKELGLEPHVQFLGFRTDARKIAAQADLFVLPSRWEGMPNALMEALADGVASVATSVEGSKELLGDVPNLVPVDDVNALADKVIELLLDDATRRKCAKNAQHHILKNFQLDKMVSETYDLYRRSTEQQIV